MTDFTSERVSPAAYQTNVENQLIYLLHERTYRFAAERVNDQTVLDFGCGDGYGTFMLAQHAQRIIGVDVDAAAITVAQQKYRHSALSFEGLAPSRRTLPFESDYFDTVVSFQVIEHVDDVRDYLREIRRVLRSNGRFLLSTPNAQSRLLFFQNPWNKHHMREFSVHQLTRAIEPHFEVEQTFGLTYTPQWLQVESRRVARDKWVLWPLTNKLVPGPLRRHLLQRVWDIAARRKNRRREGCALTPGIDDALVTTENILACPSLLLVCRKAD